MDGRVLRLWGLWALLIGTWAWAAGDPPAIKAISQLQISGNHDFPTEQILDQLRSHPRAIEAANRTTQEWHTTARSLLLNGYHSLGYADATVTIAGRGQLLISEGPHYKTGDIRIHGASDSLALAIRTQLSGSPKESPLDSSSVQASKKPTITFNTNGPAGMKQESNEKAWQSGKSWEFNEEARLYLQKVATEAIELDGRSGGELTVHFESEASAALMHLVVDVTDMGRAVEVSEFVVEGLTKDTPEEFIQSLGLKPGPCSLADRQAIETQLRDSARYLSHRLELLEPFRSDDPHRLFIHVKECPGAPKLTEPLSLEQVALLKVRDWLENFETHGHQWVISASGAPSPGYTGLWHDGKFDVQLILSPSRQYGLRLENKRTSDGLLRGYLVGVTESWISIASHQTGRQLTIRRPDGPKPFLTLNFQGQDVPHKKENISLMFGYGFNSKTKNAPLQIRVAPAALLYVPTEETHEMHIADKVLHIESSFASTRIDAETGRLLLSQPRAGSLVENTSLKFYTEPDNFDTNWRSWTEPRKFAAAGSVEKPVTSLVEFVVEEWNLIDPSGATARRAVLKLIGPDLLSAVDKRYLTQNKGNTGKFNIPWEKAGIAANIASVVLKLEGQLLRPDSTAAEVAQGLTRTVLEEKPENLQRLLQAAARPDCGPLSCVVFGTLASWSTPEVGPLFGRLGLGRMSEESFQDDLNQWLDHEQLIGKAAIRVVQRVRELTPEESLALANLSPSPKEVKLLTEVLDEMRRPEPILDPSEAAARDLQRFCAGFTRLWTPVLRPFIELQLRRLAAATMPKAA